MHPFIVGKPGEVPIEEVERVDRGGTIAQAQGIAERGQHGGEEEHAGMTDEHGTEEGQ